MGTTFEHKEKARIVTPLRCDRSAKKILQFSLRSSRPRTTCRDIVVECSGPGEADDRLIVRAVCTTPKSRDEFIELAEGYARSVKAALE
jgi:hypothetical protein